MCANAPARRKARFSALAIPLAVSFYHPTAPGAVSSRDRISCRTKFTGQHAASPEVRPREKKIESEVLSLLKKKKYGPVKLATVESTGQPQKDVGREPERTIYIARERPTEEEVCA